VGTGGTGQLVISRVRSHPVVRFIARTLPRQLKTVVFTDQLDVEVRPGHVPARHNWLRKGHCRHAAPCVSQWITDIAQKAELEAIGLQPKKDAEAALLAAVPPEPYTVVVRGKRNSQGVALVEGYNVGWASRVRALVSSVQAKATR